MIDIKVIKNILSPETDNLISTDDFITQEIVLLLRQGKKSRIDKCFKPIPNKHPLPKFTVEVFCKHCGSHEIELMSKAALLNYICNVENTYCCDACRKKDEEEIKKQQAIVIEERAKEQATVTQQFIEKFLKSVEETRISIGSIRAAWNGVDWDIISKHIRKMQYSDFLNTAYWKNISFEVKSRAGFKCQLCGKGGSLNVHHRDYSIHGDELHNISDLTCLCADCHAKIHGKYKKE